MYNRKKRLFLTAVCLSLGLLTGCNVGDTKNYKQAAQDLEQGNYEAALEEYETAISEGVKPAQSYRGAGVAKLKLGNYEEAITYFNDALKCDKVGKALKKDILSYRAVAYLKVKDYEAALEDCQTLAENYKMDADLYFLTGETALAMDSYEEASANFEQAYGEDATYDRAIQIYGAYLNRDMEADGTRYLEAALSGTAKNAEDHCDRGRVYYYMDDYENAESELKQAIDGDNGLALCDIEDGDYDSALSDIESGIHVAGAEDMQSLLFNEIVVYEKKLDFQTALQKAQEYLENCIHNQDSSGGVIECRVQGMPVGIGEPVFDKLDATLAKAMLSIGAVKGFEIGDGFLAATATGSTNNDAFVIQDEQVKKQTNHSGGVLGGMSDGDEIVFRVAVKPTPSISQAQQTVDLHGKERQIYRLLSLTDRRHDPVIVPRAVVVVESMAAITLVDALFANMSARMDAIVDFYQKR